MSTHSNGTHVSSYSTRRSTGSHGKRRKEHLDEAADLVGHASDGSVVLRDDIPLQGNFSYESSPDSSFLPQSHSFSHSTQSNPRQIQQQQSMGTRSRSKRLSRGAASPTQMSHSYSGMDDLLQLPLNPMNTNTLTMNTSIANPVIPANQRTILLDISNKSQISTRRQKQQLTITTNSTNPVPEVPPAAADKLQAQVAPSVIPTTALLDASFERRTYKQQSRAVDGLNTSTDLDESFDSAAGMYPPTIHLDTSTSSLSAEKSKVRHSLTTEEEEEIHLLNSSTESASSYAADMNSLSINQTHGSFSLTLNTSLTHQHSFTSNNTSTTSAASSHVLGNGSFSSMLSDGMMDTSITDASNNSITLSQEAAIALNKETITANATAVTLPTVVPPFVPTSSFISHPAESPQAPSVTFHEEEGNSAKLLSGSSHSSSSSRRAVSTTPHILTTSASTLTGSMAHSLQLDHVVPSSRNPSSKNLVAQTAAVPTAAAEAAAAQDASMMDASCLLPDAPAFVRNAVAASEAAAANPQSMAAQPSLNGAASNQWTQQCLAQLADSKNAAVATGAEVMDTDGNATALVAASSPGLTQQQLSALLPMEEYSESILDHMLALEKKYLPNPQYMEQTQTDLSYFMRSILMDWLIEVAEEYQLCNQTLYLCVGYVDRYLSTFPVDRAKLQLLGVSAMLVASKYWEIRAPSIDDFIYISDSTYSREQVLAMEGELLNALKFQLMSITPWDCCTRIGGRMGREIFPERTEHLASMMMELLVLESQYIQYRPSVIAVSAIFLALYTTYQNPWPAELESACGLTVESIQLCVRVMHAAYLRMCQNPNGFVAQVGVPPLMAIREKYSHARFANVAEIVPRDLQGNTPTPEQQAAAGAIAATDASPASSQDSNQQA